MSDIRFGALLWNQYTTWPAMLDAGQRADRLGYDTLWTWDHLYPIVGSDDGPILEGWLTLAAWAQATERVRLGSDGRREHVPGAVAHREDGHDARPHLERTGDPGHRRRLVRDGTRGVRPGVRRRLPGAAALAGRGAADHARHAPWRTADRGRAALHHEGRAQRPAAHPGAPADPHRRWRRAGHAQAGRTLRRRQQRRRRRSRT